MRRLEISRRFIALTVEADHLETPRACPVASHVGGYCSYKRETPRDKPVASGNHCSYKRETPRDKPLASGNHCSYKRETPRDKPLASGNHCSYKRETPRDKPVASGNHCGYKRETPRDKPRASGNHCSYKRETPRDKPVGSKFNRSRAPSHKPRCCAGRRDPDKRFSASPARRRAAACVSP